MRDARSQGREERGAGRDRDLAGRSRPLIEDALRIAAATLVDALAFVIWNLGPRSPLRLLRDIVTGMRRPGSLLRGIVTFVAGLLLLIGSLSILLPLEVGSRTFAILVVWAGLTGLALEQIVSPMLPTRATNEPKR